MRVPGDVGDMGCHTLNLPFHALQLSSVTSAEAVQVNGRMPETSPRPSMRPTAHTHAVMKEPP